jgi:hypothetical protein
MVLPVQQHAMTAVAMAALKALLPEQPTPQFRRLPRWKFAPALAFPFRQCQGKNCLGHAFGEIIDAFQLLQDIHFQGVGSQPVGFLGDQALGFVHGG